MQHLETDTVYLDPWRGREEQTASVHVPLITRIGMYHNLGIPAFKDNPASCVQVGGTRNILFSLAG